MSQNTKFEIWHGLITEAMPERNIDYAHSMNLYQLAAMVWAEGKTYTANFAPVPVDLTKLYDQAIMLATLKGTNDGTQI